MFRPLDHPDYLALVRVIRENPNDPDPRRIIADWLDDFGLCRWATFVRAHVSLTVAYPDWDNVSYHLSSLMPEHGGMVATAMQTLENAVPEMEQEFPGGRTYRSSQWFDYRMGMITTAHLQYHKTLWEIGPPLLKANPITYVGISGLDLCQRPSGMCSVMIPRPLRNGESWGEEPLFHSRTDAERFISSRFIEWCMRINGEAATSELRP
jgi:uncharacterized protein (TIGR02996 family)